jgi:hypothetical protein
MQRMRMKEMERRMSQSSATDTWKTLEERELGKKLAERQLELATFQGVFLDLLRLYRLQEVVFRMLQVR